MPMAGTGALGFRGCRRGTLSKPSALLVMSSYPTHTFCAPFSVFAEAGYVRSKTQWSVCISQSFDPFIETDTLPGQPKEIGL